MAKSKIIKELANGTVTTQVALKRAKLLLQEFNNDALLEWVNHELMGYTDVGTIPDYRIKQGHLRGTYIRGTTSYKNVPLPVGKMPQELVTTLLSVYFSEGVEELAQFMEGHKDQPVGKPIPADFYPRFAYYNEDPYMRIISARSEVSVQSVQGVLTAVENKLLDLFCYLEEQFGVLDELDIDVASKTAEEQKDIVNHISVLIYNDRRVTMGNNNKIKESTIASTMD